MDPITIGILGGLLFGGAKTAHDEMGRSSDKKVQAATTRYSPWTGMKADAPRQVDPFSNLASGALSGAMLGNVGTKAGWWGGVQNPLAAGAGSGPLAGSMNRFMPSRPY